MRSNAPDRAVVLDAGLLVAFLNTLDVEDGTDELAADGSAHAWARSHGLRTGDRTEAQRVRDALRSLVDGEPAELPDVALTAVAAERGVGLRARTMAEAAVGAALTLSLQGRLSRVRLCGADDCRWAFYDESRNGSRQWCSMGVCGNRQKARTYRARKEQTGDREAPGAG